jgi:hypothetical protein
MKIEFENLSAANYEELTSYVQSRNNERDNKGRLILKLKYSGKTRSGVHDLIYNNVQLVLRDNNSVSKIIQTLKGLAKVLSE